IKSDDLRYRSREFRYGDVFTHTNVDELQGRIILQDEHASISKIIDVEKLAPRCSCAPDDNSRRIINFCFVEPSDQCGDDMAVFGMVIVSRPIEVRRHHRYEITSVLAPVCLAKLNASDLRNGIGFVRRLERTSQQLIFAHGLLGKFRVNATRSEE